MLIDALQFVNPSRRIFQQMRDGGVDAVHMTVSYHEGFRETAAALGRWNRQFEAHLDLILRGTTAADIQQARETGRTAIFFGAQTPAPIEDDIDLIEIVYQMGLRFMQLSYNTQSLICAGCYEPEDSGLTLFGQEVVREMNRVGLVIDMSHSGDRSRRAAIEASERPIAITHANPAFWHDHPRNVQTETLKALAQRGGMLGFSLYPLHLKDGGDCALDSFCSMVAATAEIMGVENLGIGSDLCQDQPDSAVAWMRDGRWKKERNPDAAFPAQPDWFRSNLDFGNVSKGLQAKGFAEADVTAIMGGNWERFFAVSFGPVGGTA